MYQRGVDLLLVKLIATPLLILAASLAGRRWGEAVSGWFVGLPLTSGPVCLFLALEQGTPFAASTGLGCLAGAAAEAGFCLAYAVTARQAGWPLALAAATLAYAAGAALLASMPLSIMPLAGFVAIVLTLTLWLLPDNVAMPLALPAAPAWEIPARMAVATGLVLGLTALAPLVGAQLGGLLTTYPVFAAVLAAFAQRARGATAAMRVLRGLLVGLFGFTGFFAVIVPGLPHLGIALSFLLASAAALAIQGMTLVIVRS